MKRFIIKAMQAVVAVLIYAGILWYSINADADASGATAYGMIAVISLGIAYGVTVAVFRVASEIGGSIMVIATFLNRHLLEPQKQRLMAQGLEQGRHQGLEQGLERGRKEERNNIREHLRQQGYDPDELLPPQEDDRK